MRTNGTRSVKERSYDCFHLKQALKPFRALLINKERRSTCTNSSQQQRQMEALWLYKEGPLTLSAAQVKEIAEYHVQKLNFEIKVQELASAILAIDELHMSYTDGSTGSNNSWGSAPSSSSVSTLQQTSQDNPLIKHTSLDQITGLHLHKAVLEAPQGRTRSCTRSEVWLGWVRTHTCNCAIFSRCSEL